MRVLLEHGVVDLQRRVFARERPVVAEVALTTIEARLLAHLAKHAGRVFTREELQVEVWGYRPGIPTRTVFTTVGRIRQKIEPSPAAPCHLLCVGGGYTLAGISVVMEARAAPQPATPFVGRLRELDEIETALDQGARLVSLLGPGGIGKTRIALELAQRRLRSGGSCVFVEAQAITSASQLVQAMVGATEVRPIGDGEDELAGLLERFRSRETLLVIDNIEQIEGAASVLAAVVKACPRVSLVVTTRVRLSLSAERAVQIGPMQTPLHGASLTSCDAGCLLLQAFTRERPAWRPNDAETNDLARLCELLEGSPLAMELSAAWFRLLEPRDIVAELTRGGALPASGRIDAPKRHESLKAALEASFRLLAPESVSALGALSSLRAPFSREAAAAVAGADLRVLGQLLDASMIRRVEGGRFTFHPAVREESRERLRDDERASSAGRHAAYFVDRVVDAHQALDQGEMGEQEYVDLVTAEHLDVVAAFEHAMNQTDLRDVVRAARPLYHYLDASNRFADLSAIWARAKASLRPSERAMAKPALAYLVALEQGAGWATPEPPIDMGELTHIGAEAVMVGLIGVAIARLLSGRFDESEASSLEAIAIARRERRRFSLGFALSVCASACSRVGRHRDASSLLEEAVALASLRGRRSLCRPLVHLGEVRLAEGDAQRARETLEKALTACREANDRAFAVLALSKLGEAHAALGDDPMAAWTEAVEEACALHVPPYWWGGALLGLARSRLAPAGASQVVAALACAHRCPGIGPLRPSIEGLLARCAELFGDDLVASWTRASEGLELEAAALSLVLPDESSGSTKPGYF